MAIKLTGKRCSKNKLFKEILNPFYDCDRIITSK